MSKELEEGLRPKRVPMNDKEQLERAIDFLRAAVKSGHAWMVTICEDDGVVRSSGRYTEETALLCALSALEGWADAAAFGNDFLPRRLLHQFHRDVGASREYIFGGVVPERE